MKLPTNHFVTSQRLNTIAAEEASRFGQHTVDLDHLFLSLIADGEEAGVTLRELGVTLTDARRAVQNQRVDQLAALGIAADISPGNIRQDAPTDFEFSDRALELLRQASSRSEAPGSVVVLQQLLAEPSGLIDELLRRLHIDRELLGARIDAAGARHSTTVAAQDNAVSATTEIYVAAAVSEVRDFLARPGTLPQWVPGIDRLNDSSDGVGPAEIINDSAGKAYRRREANLLRSDATAVTWELTHLDTPEETPQRVELKLSPEGAGTRAQVTVSFGLRSATVVRKAIRRGLRPLHRFSVRMYSQSVGNQINRAFR